MEALGIVTGADLREWSLAALESQFGSSGAWYWRICRGIDERAVKPDRPYKSVSAERTFDEDLSDPERLAAELERIAGYAWDRVERAEVAGRTVTLKVKYRRLFNHHAIEKLSGKHCRPRRIYCCWPSPSERPSSAAARNSPARPGAA